MSLCCTWETPARRPAVPCRPQLPVAREYFRPRVMVSLLMADCTHSCTQHRQPITTTATGAHRPCCFNNETRKLLRPHPTH